MELPLVRRLGQRIIRHQQGSEKRGRVLGVGGLSYLDGGGVFAADGVVEVELEIGYRLLLDPEALSRRRRGCDDEGDEQQNEAGLAHFRRRRRRYVQICIKQSAL
ncbi:hypothetical protein V6N12_011116 [Hibiscus sabdariffa]|uniref:Uncharacterized protein n=1 Tax=Hibiscus sabdariffa TaxID=183260 RepID=A0ABR2EM30_9ROSI